ncbi:MAG TPA: protoporphyrinogen oxidase [Micropruina sp.]|nr:protoporphyrinogen oxidase [Micropruina sp.]
MTRLLVIGGGITGLAAAWQGVRSGADVLLVEADHRLGGAVHTQRTDGLLIENGPDSFDKHPDDARRLVDELGLGGQVIHPSPVAGERAFVRSGGRLRPVPVGFGPVLPTELGQLATTPILSPLDKLRAAADLLQPRRLEAGDAAIGPFLRARLGEGVVRKLVDPVVGGGYGGSLDELSLDAVLPALRGQEGEYRSLLIAARHERPSTAAGATVPFVSLREGLGSLVHALAEQLAVAGAEVRTGVAALGIGRHPTCSRVALSDGSTYPVDAIVLAGAATSSARLLAPHAPAAGAALATLQSAPTTVVTLAYPVGAFPEPPGFHEWVENQPGAVRRVTLSSVKWAGRAPDDVVLIRAVIARRVAQAPLPDASLAATVGVQLRRVLGVVGEPVHRTVSRWSMPLYAVGHRARVAAATSALAAVPGWHLAGSAFNGTGIAQCIADGRRAASMALATAG